jgi:hypothetical protein
MADTAAEFEGAFETHVTVRADGPSSVEALRAWAEARRGSDDVADETACARWCEQRLAAMPAPPLASPASVSP